MIVEFTGRQYEVTPAVRKQVEHGLEKLQKILGKTFDTHVILAAEKNATSLRSPSRFAIIHL